MLLAFNCGSRRVRGGGLGRCFDLDAGGRGRGSGAEASRPEQKPLSERGGQGVSVASRQRVPRARRTGPPHRRPRSQNRRRGSSCWKALRNETMALRSARQRTCPRDCKGPGYWQLEDPPGPIEASGVDKKVFCMTTSFRYDRTTTARPPAIRGATSPR